MKDYPLSQIILSFTIILCLQGLIFIYPTYRLTATLDLTKAWNTAFWGFAIFSLSATFSTIFLMVSGVLNNRIRPLYWVGLIVFGFFVILFAMVAASDLLWLILWTVKKFALLFSTSTIELDPSRRLFLSRAAGIGIFILTAGLTAYGLIRAGIKPKIVRVRIPFPNLPAALEGFRIVEIVDLHVGPTLRAEFVRDVVERINGLSPDVVVLPGDLVDGRVGKMREEIAPLANLRAPHGVFFTTGNHEYYAGALEWVDEVKKLGPTVLVNEHRVIERGGAKILMAGVTDFSEGWRVPGHASDPFRAMAGAPECDLKILLAHQPKSIFSAEKAGFDLQLSGHTHGGQFYPLPWFVWFAQPFLKGLHQYGRSWVYVSVGTGYWGPPIRIGTVPEITEITLVRGPRENG